jgi:predicted transposase YdaD
MLENQLIATVIFYKLSRLTREEIQTMLQIHDIRESRLYQDILQEGVDKGIALAIAKFKFRLSRF